MITNGARAYWETNLKEKKVYYERPRRTTEFDTSVFNIYISTAGKYRHLMCARRATTSECSPSSAMPKAVSPSCVCGGNGHKSNQNDRENSINNSRELHAADDKKKDYLQNHSWQQMSAVVPREAVKLIKRTIPSSSCVSHLDTAFMKNTWFGGRGLRGHHHFSPHVRKEKVESQQTVDSNTLTPCQ